MDGSENSRLFDMKHELDCEIYQEMDMWIKRDVKRNEKKGSLSIKYLMYEHWKLGD
jgi:hypothetical protein